MLNARTASGEYTIAWLQAESFSAAVKVIEEVTAKQVTQLRGLPGHFQDMSRLASENFVSTQKTTVATKKQKQDVEQIVTAMKSLDSLSEKMMETQQRFKLGEVTA